ncbi:MAG: winged helix-turn-helix domain-containing protein [Micavibrio aeruginosavorus]|uniref:Winged helix-turn-helix domain-containing protein n=1 Tax=Micavibrio aeruginosavorus TaxID=349221 RepID=A0A7T5UGK9_9BACT|nr:MAG: winged helix-turn-helix domain-containing protein [Micavibrio aeruginosavorus]
MSESSAKPVLVFASDPVVQRVLTSLAPAFALTLQFCDDPRQAALKLSPPLRAGTVLRRLQGLKQAAPLPPLGRFLFDPSLALLVDEESAEEVALTEKESAILSCLLSAPGHAVSRRDLLQHVWGYVEGVETHTIETHIYRLRQKIEIDPGNPVTLLTEEQGYRLMLA